MHHRVDDGVARVRYGAAPGVLDYIVYTPLLGGTHPCLDPARLDDELFLAHQCRVPRLRRRPLPATPDEVTAALATAPAPTRHTAWI